MINLSLCTIVRWAKPKPSKFLFQGRFRLIHPDLPLSRFPLLSPILVWIKSKDSLLQEVRCWFNFQIFWGNIRQISREKGGKETVFDFLPCKYTPTERFNDQETRDKTDIESDWCETWDPIFHQQINKRPAWEDVVKHLNGSTRRQRVTTDKRDKMYWSVFVDCCRAAKMPKKVIAANPAACRAPQLLLGERYERQWCGRGDATFRDFLRRSARKLGHCGRHTAPMQPAMIIRHFGDWATCPSPSSPGFLHAQNIDRGQYMRWRSRFRNPKLGYWSTPCNCIVQKYHKSFSCGSTTFRGFIWKWDAQSFGWAQEDNLNGAVPLCCFFTSFLGNIHSNSEYTMKKKWRQKPVQKEYTFQFQKIHLSCDGDDCGPLLPPGQNLLLTKLQSKQTGLPFAEGTARVVLKTSF